ncbi:MAG: 50S ribosomal protein L18 [Opitutia bacterium UBA7350]|nr:MAG: 50S ribosomal protein L18 [Opitutae bacterium UBA7350]
MKLEKKKTLLQRRRWRIRKKIVGTAERPRLAVHFSNKHIYAQCIDDEKGLTMAYVSSVAKESSIKANTEGANALGLQIAEKAKAAGIESVVFDRSGRRYHGCVKSFAEAARQGGLQF